MSAVVIQSVLPAVLLQSAPLVPRDITPQVQHVYRVRIIVMFALPPQLAPNVLFASLLMEAYAGLLDRVSQQQRKMANLFLVSLVALHAKLAQPMK